MQSVQDDDVNTSKLLLRTMACLAASNCVQLSGQDSLFSVLEALNDITLSSWTTNTQSTPGGNVLQVKEVLAYKGQVSAFLLATTVPWIATVFSVNGSCTADLTDSKDIFTRIGGTLDRVRSDWVSPYDVGGQQAIFHVPTEHATNDKTSGKSLPTLPFLPHLTLPSNHNCPTSFNLVKSPHTYSLIHLFYLSLTSLLATPISYASPRTSLIILSTHIFYPYLLYLTLYLVLLSPLIPLSLFLSLFLSLPLFLSPPVPPSLSVSLPLFQEPTAPPLQALSAPHAGTLYTRRAR